MHFTSLLTLAALTLQGALAVNVLTYSGRDCTGTVQDVHVDNNEACSTKTKPFMSYKENGFGKSNGQRIAFYNQPSCSANSFLYDTYSYDGDYFHSKQCYNIDGHSPVSVARGMKLY
ncbi:hypothetical protein BJY04DRAFT_213266 [Aspergillus karnatakaensis]|uniref:uncharacterized protein n=1 Tax=Aspergillus karnatakaensis TaxID=1810916 RepID=UPI003CCD11E4